VVKPPCPPSDSHVRKPCVALFGGRCERDKQVPPQLDRTRKFFVSKKCPLIDKTKMQTSQQDAFLWGCSDWSDVNDL